MGSARRGAYPRLTVLALFALRLAIGWHFTYEAYAKVSNPRPFSAKGYLSDARGPLAPVFHWMGETAWVLAPVNVVIAWGMLLLGAAFMLGMFTRISGACLMVLLACFYLATPPWTGIKLAGEEGSYLFVNKNLVELVAIAAVLASGISRTWGLDALIARRERAVEARGAESAGERADSSRDLPPVAGPRP